MCRSHHRNPPTYIRYTRRWLQVLSRRNDVPEKWLTGVLNGSSTTRTEANVARLAQEQRELTEYESMGCDVDGLDDKEQVLDMRISVLEREEAFV